MDPRAPRKWCAWPGLDLCIPLSWDGSRGSARPGRLPGGTRPSTFSEISFVCVAAVRCGIFSRNPFDPERDIIFAPIR